MPRQLPLGQIGREEAFTRRQPALMPQRHPPTRAMGFAGLKPSYGLVM